MTNLQRLLNGEPATYDRFEILCVHDFSNEDDESLSILIVYLQNSIAQSVWRSKKNVEGNQVQFVEPPKPRTIEDGLQTGDTIKNKDYSRMILGVNGKIIFPSVQDDFTKTDGIYLINELIESGYKLVVEEPVKEPERTWTKDEVRALMFKSFGHAFLSSPQGNDTIGKWIDKELGEIKEEKKEDCDEAKWEE